jgi:hypothetical protein
MAMTGFTIGELNNLVPVAAGLTKDDAGAHAARYPGYRLGRLLAAGPLPVWRVDSNALIYSCFPL